MATVKNNNGLDNNYTWSTRNDAIITKSNPEVNSM